MGLFSYTILDKDGNKTEESFEELFKAGKAPDFLYSSDGRIAKKDVSLIAKTAGYWGNGGNLNGTFDPGLGQFIEGSAHRDRVMKERGLVALSDVGNINTARDAYEKKKEKNEYWDKRQGELEELEKIHTPEIASVHWTTREKLEEDKKHYDKGVSEINIHK